MQNTFIMKSDKDFAESSVALLFFVSGHSIDGGKVVLLCKSIKDLR